MANEYIDYNNTEKPYVPARDPRSVNVVENIKKEAAIKATFPVVEDDHVCMHTLEQKLASVTKELADLKNSNMVKDLLAAFSEGGEIALAESVNAPTAFTIEKDVTLNLNGKSMTISEDTDGSGVFHVTGGTLTIDGNGTINGVGKNDYNMAIWADGGNVVINGGTFTNEGATAEVDPAHFDLIYAKKGATVEINGGCFRCATPKWTLNNNDSAPGNIIVKGGTFVNYDPSNSETEPGGLVSFVAEGYKVISAVMDNGETWYSVVAE